MDSKQGNENDEELDNMENGNSVISYVTSTKSEASSDTEKATKPKLITHLSLTREDSPLLDPSKPVRKTPQHCAARLWKAYQQSIDEYPIITKSLTSAVLTAFGEVISQLLVNFGVVDMKRMWEFFFLGLLLQAPVSHYYYLVLDRELPPTSYPWTWTTFIKLLIDQLLFAPAFLFSVFIFLDTLEGLGPMQMMMHLKQDFGMTLITNWKLWVPATLINLGFVHPSYRVLYNNCIFFVWSIILAMLLLSPEADR